MTAQRKSSGVRRFDGSHPRGAGTFAKWIEEFVVRTSQVPLEEAASTPRCEDSGV